MIVSSFCFLLVSPGFARGFFILYYSFICLQFFVFMVCVYYRLWSKSFLEVSFMYGLLTVFWNAFFSATVTPPALGDIVNSGLINTLRDIYIQVTTLFTIFPVNVFLTLTIISMAIALISKVVSSFRAAN